MAMQICVLTDERIESSVQWQKAIDSEGFSLRLSDADATRNLAAYLGEEETSIEYDVHDFRELKDAYNHINFGHDWRYAIAFTWSSDFAEELAAWMAATAYAEVTTGVIFDEQEGKVFSPEEARQVTREIQRRRPEMERVIRSYIEGVKAKSSDAEAALSDFMQRRLGKSNRG